MSVIKITDKKPEINKQVIAKLLLGDTVKYSVGFRDSEMGYRCSFTGFYPVSPILEWTYVSDIQGNIDYHCVNLSDPMAVVYSFMSEKNGTWGHGTKSKELSDKIIGRFNNLKGKHVYSFVMPTHQTDYSKVAEAVSAAVNDGKSLSGQIHSALSGAAAELKIPVSMITGENMDEETIKAFNDAFSALHASQASPQTETPMMDFLNTGIDNIERDLYSVKYEAFRHPHQEELDREEKEIKGKYKIIDVSDCLDRSRLFIHYEIESYEASEFVCECKSIGAANVIVAALESFNDAFFTGSEG